MGPLRIRVLSLESKLTPHARPVVDRRDGTFGKVPNLIFPPLTFWSPMVIQFLRQLLFQGAVAADHARPFVRLLVPPTMLIFYAVLSLKAKESQKGQIKICLREGHTNIGGVIVDARFMCKKSPNVNPPLNKETLLAVRSVLEHNRRQKKNQVLSLMSLLLGGGGITLATVPLQVLTLLLFIEVSM